MGGRDGHTNSDIQKHTLKRVMKTIDNFILSEYHLLFKNQSQHSSEHSKEFVVKQSDLFTNEKLLRKAKEELQFCEDTRVTPLDLIKKCLEELERLGFANSLQEEAIEHMFSIKDQKDKLKEFIVQKLQGQSKGMNFNDIYRLVSQNFDRFYTKDMVFKVIDNLF